MRLITKEWPEVRARRSHFVSQVGEGHFDKDMGIEPGSKETKVFPKMRRTVFGDINSHRTQVWL